MDKFSEFLARYFDVEWETWEAFATEPDYKVFEAKLDAMDDLRLDQLHPKFSRRPSKKVAKLKGYMNEAEHRRLFAVALNADAGVGAAYVGPIRGAHGSIQERMIAVRSEGTWKMLLQQYSCQVCKGGDSACGSCKGRGWEPSHTELPPGLKGLTEFKVIKPATDPYSKGLWERLESGSSPSVR